MLKEPGMWYVSLAIGVLIVGFLSLFKLLGAAIIGDPWPWNWSIVQVVMSAITYGMLKWQEDR